MFDVKDSDFFDVEEEDFDTILAPDIKFRGTIHFKKPFMIRGTVTGTIDATSDLVVDTDAIVTAGINASRVLIRGKVEGDIIAKDVVFVTKSGSVTGDITSKEVVLEPGAHFSGKCTMTSD